MKIYLDNCCWNRPFDGYTDEQSVDEEAAIETIIEISKAAGYRIFSSPAVVGEMNAMKAKKPGKWADVSKFYDDAKTVFIESTPNIVTRAQGFCAAGLRGRDHLHLAFAEAAGVDVLLSTDIRFINTCAKMNLSIVNVMNPINFLPEVAEWVQ